jgi:hypothetical protein
MVEYEQIREGLIALICVGDKIHRIYRVRGSYNKYTGVCDIYYKVTDNTITHIPDGRSIGLGGSQFRTVQPTELIEHYKGELYFWSALDMYQIHTRAQKLSKMVQILESDDTVFE